LPPIEEFRTRSTYDIQGNLLRITDPLDRVAFEHVYDLSKRVLRIESIDAGTRRMVLNAVGNEVQRRDSKRAVSLNRYDILNRPLELWARDRTGQAITLRERLVYGDESDPNQTSQKRTAERNRNRLGKLTEHYDEAGRVKFALYDFKGNSLDKSREVISDNAVAAGWIATWSAANADDAIDTATLYQTTTQYDALNRPTQIQYPADINGDRAQLMPTYNRAGALEQISLDGDVYVQRIAYNAKGQRVFIACGNGVFTRYAYDEQTFRLKRLRTEHFTRTGDDYQPNGVLLQDFAYDYDLAGNILTIHDRVRGCGVPADPQKLDREFEYDAIYRLTSATGRECNVAPTDPYWVDTPHCQDVTSTRRYTQTYKYDPAGNMVELNHDAPNGGSFTRGFMMMAENNRLGTVRVGTRTYDHQYDDNGNMTQETLSRVFTWDHADRLLEFQETAGGNPSKLARYLYDSTGIRVKKWVRTNATAANDQSTIYVDGIFEFFRWRELGQTKNNNRLHVMDNQSRITLVRVGDVDDQKPDIQYQLGDHLGSSNVVIGGSSSADDALINREECFPYGETSFGSFGRKRYRFTGEERDEESGLGYHQARYFASWQARWISPDPLARATGNLYSYAGNSPMKRVDLNGKEDGPSLPMSGRIPQTSNVTPREFQGLAQRGLVEQGYGQRLIPGYEMGELALGTQGTLVQGPAGQRTVSVAGLREGENLMMHVHPRGTTLPSPGDLHYLAEQTRQIEHVILTKGGVSYVRFVPELNAGYVAVYRYRGGEPTYYRFVRFSGEYVIGEATSAEVQRLMSAARVGGSAPGPRSSRLLPLLGFLIAATANTPAATGTADVLDPHFLESVESEGTWPARAIINMILGRPEPSDVPRHIQGQREAIKAERKAEAQEVARQREILRAEEERLYQLQRGAAEGGPAN
jgi:RHS repeat-associated protein